MNRHSSVSELIFVHLDSEQYMFVYFIHIYNLLINQSMFECIKYKFSQNFVSVEARASGREKNKNLCDAYSIAVNFGRMSVFKSRLSCVQFRKLVP